MPDVQADPDKLRQLARMMTSASQQLEVLSKQVRKALDGCGWRDSERVKFEQQLAPDLKQLHAMSERLRSQYPPILQRKAEALDEFRR
jgi:hypothetical protein